MKFRALILIAYLTSISAIGQVAIPEYYSQEKSFDAALKKIVSSVGLDGRYDAGEDGMEGISFAVIDLSGKQPVLGGFNADNFIYPASVYKIYAGMEVLKQIDNGEYSLYENYIVKSPNDVDKTKEISYDPRPLLRAGDSVTVNYLLDLMITRSDNSAANCIIDLAGRKNINATMHKNGWHGSEVTRKFLSRKFEDPGYDTVRGTETCALHAADFMYRVYSDQLVSSWVSQQMKSFLSRQLDTAKLSMGLPRDVMFYHKTGWWSYYTNDVGIVDDGHVKYIIALFTPIPENKVRPKLKEISQRVHQLIRGRHL